ncbi:MAG TPA: hypothetical protein PKZ16_01580 [bacterium]|nr:hypothetical protein [bacterium]HPL95547.1 hypothetical protein [bacterium]
MDKAEDTKLISLFLTMVVAGLFLLIFPGLRNMASRFAFFIILFLFFWELAKWAFVGLEIK